MTQSTVYSYKLASCQSDLYLEVVLRRLSQVPADLGWRLTTPGLTHYLDLGPLGEVALLPQYLHTLRSHCNRKGELRGGKIKVQY